MTIFVTTFVFGTFVILLEIYGHLVIEGWVLDRKIQSKIIPTFNKDNERVAYRGFKSDVLVSDENAAFLRNSFEQLNTVRSSAVPTVLTLGKLRRAPPPLRPDWLERHPNGLIDAARYTQPVPEGVSPVQCAYNVLDEKEKQ